MSELTNQRFSDLTVVINNRSFRLNKAILALKSEYFNNLFTNELTSPALVSAKDKNGEPGELIIEMHTDPDNTIHFLYFFYSPDHVFANFLKTATYKVLCEMYELAEYYECPTYIAIATGVVSNMDSYQLSALIDHSLKHESNATKKLIANYPYSSELLKRLNKNYREYILQALITMNPKGTISLINHLLLEIPQKTLSHNEMMNTFFNRR